MNFLTSTAKNIRHAKKLGSHSDPKGLRSYSKFDENLANSRTPDPLVKVKSS